jgi:hypothetical protein
MSAFCDPETTTSRPHASVSHGTAPRLETRVDDDERSGLLRRGCERTHVGDDPGGGLGLHEPDRLRLLLAEARAEVVGIGVLPQAYRSTSTSAPNAVVIATQRSPKLPAETTRCRSPGETRFATADSKAPVPDAPKRSTSLSVRQTSRSRVSTRS